MSHTNKSSVGLVFPSQYALPRVERDEEVCHGRKSQNTEKQRSSLTHP